jgi:hypothetical protein
MILKSSLKSVGGDLRAMRKRRKRKKHMEALLPQKAMRTTANKTLENPWTPRTTQSLCINNRVPRPQAR